ncbi:hypothetical protein CFIMG_005432RA [Ceratocystis fimbriata CBS 114723]|uniref:Rhodopsin domain-containing protein n=1 Tax=Ceratocystis fimbriata CBS 114723 TaxID=1035309 RepID=A0A2C5WCP5_9PEZI|nr:hypothetical protein CFIMG_005432RA [Ceratocystis fimbriata CBS 114723]
MSNHLLLAVETQLKLLARATGDNATAAPVAPPRTVADGYPYSSKQQLAFAILFIFPILALLVVGLRVYARLKFRQFGIDDSLICIAMVISCGETFSSYMYIRKAYFGVHIWDVPIDSDMANAWMWNFIVQIMYNPILAVVKTSVLLFLMRLGGQKPGIRWSIHFLNAFNIMLGIGTFVTVIFQCTPVDFYWEAHAKNPPTSGSCIDMGAFYVSTAGLTILTDILVLALPVWIFMGLKMAFKLKVALVCVFSLGGVVTIVSILRLVQIYEFSYGKPSADPTYDIRFIYSAVETNLAIIAASAPAIRGLISKWFPGFFTSVSSSHVVYGTDGLAVSGNKKSRSASRGPAGALESGRSTLGASHSDSFAMKSMKKHDPNAIPSPTASEEHIMAMSYDGIVRKTEVSVAYDDQGRSIDERQYRSHSRDASSDAAGISGYSRTMASPGV